MTTIRLIFSIAALLLLESCASMGKDQCLTADWRTIGFEDGARGLSAEEIAQHRRDCAEYGVTPDLKAYLAGREQGLAQYCKPDNGFRIGESGRAYDGVCPQALESNFLSGYQTGHHLYVLQSAVRSVDYQLQAQRHELDTTNKRMAEKTEAVIAKNTTTKERVELLLDINRLNDRKHHLKREIISLRQQRDARQADLVAYQRTLQMQ